MLLRKAAAGLIASPLFTAFAVLSLAAGVAVTTAVYSVVDKLLFTQFAARDPSSLSFVMAPSGGMMRHAAISGEELSALKASHRSFERVSGSTSLFAQVVSTRHAELVNVEAVDGDYFATVGVTAAVGRVLDGGDERSHARVAMVSADYWRTRFAADPKVLSRTLTVNGQTFDIAGVVKAPYAGIDGRMLGTAIWVPLSVAEELRGDLQMSSHTEARLTVVGRLAPGATHAAAAAEIETIATQLDASRARVSSPPTAPVRPRQWTSRSAAEQPDEDDGVNQTGVILVALVALVLVVACTNLANLVLARGTARQGELAIRMAMGASRGRLIWEQCVEGLLLSALGAVAAYVMFIAISAWMRQEFIVLFPGLGRVTLSIHPEINTDALIVSLVALALSLAVFGLEPAVHLARSLDIRTVLAVGATGVRPRVARQRMIIRWQVAIAAGFFIVATMFIRATVEQARHESGVDIERLAITTFALPQQSWNEPRIRRAVERVIEEAAGEPSVAAIAASTGLPFGIPPALRVPVAHPGDLVDARTPLTAVAGIAATPSLFQVLGIPIVRGRAFNDSDGPATPAVGVISELAAKQFFRATDPIGLTLQLTLGGKQRPVTSVGISRDTDVGSLNAPRRPLLFVPLAQYFDRNITITARTSTNVSATVAAVRDAARRADAEMTVDISGGGWSVLSGPFEILQSAGRGALYLGGFTLLLSMVGLFGVQSHVVAYRTREIGVRMSLGASARQIQAMVIRDGARPVVDGLILGLWAGIVGRLMVRSYLVIDVAVFDPWMLLLAPIPIVLAALCACYLPAARAARIDPTTALRCE